MAFIKCPRIIQATEVVDDGKLVLWRDFSPNGVAFKDATTAKKSEIDLRSNATFYADVDILTVGANEGVISIGADDIATYDGRGGKYPRALIHIFYNSSGKLIIDGRYRNSGAAATTRQRDITSLVKNNNIKVAINYDAVVVNGLQINGTQPFYGAQDAIIERIYQSTAHDAIVVGAEYAKSHQHINEVGFVKEYLTIEQMQALTT